MNLAFWRRPAAPEFDYLAYSAGRLADARRFHAEMEGWPEPIDVIRDALGLPLRWQVAVGRAAHSVWRTITYDPTLALFEGSSGLLAAAYRASLSTMTPPSKRWSLTDWAGTGNPIHDEALRAARRQR